MTSPASASKPNVCLVVFDGNPTHDWIQLFSVTFRTLPPHIASLPILSFLVQGHTLTDGRGISIVQVCSRGIQSTLQQL